MCLFHVAQKKGAIERLKIAMWKATQDAISGKLDKLDPETKDNTIDVRRPAERGVFQCFLIAPSLWLGVDSGS